MLLVGAGGLAAQLFDDLNGMNLNDIVFWSEVEVKYSFIKERYRVITTDQEVIDYFTNTSRLFVLCIGDIANRKKMAEKFKGLGGEISSFISPYSTISPFSSIGNGAMILRDVDIEAGASIGEECLINKQANLGHDCVVSAFCEIGPTSLVSAGVHVGENTLVGMGSIILPKLKVGSNAIIAAGSIVTKNVPDFAVVSGNPANLRFFKKK